MTFLTKKSISRRTILRGAGAAVALPFLDAMRPAMAAAAPAVSRIAVVYVPNGIVMKDWTPTATGTAFEFPRILKPLEAYRSDVTVVSGLANFGAIKVTGGGDHAKAAGSFLSGASPKRTIGADVHSGVSFDQIAAQKLAGKTALASLQMSCEDTRMVGNCDTGFACAYTNCLSWKDEFTPMSPEVNPRSVFERMFGSMDPGLDPETRRRRELYRRSILDLTMDSAKQIQTNLGTNDKRKIDEYLTSLREIESRIQAAEKNNAAFTPSIEKPAGIPLEFVDYIKLMYDLQVIAFQADVTRITTMLVGREGSVRTYPEIGVRDPHHPLTHHRGNPDFIEKVAQINMYHAELFTYFLKRLKETKDGDGNLLDHSAILYGSALSEGNSHNHRDLPLILAGHAGGRKGGQHVKVEPNTPVTNLFRTMLDTTGNHVEAFSDSTGALSI